MRISIQKNNQGFTMIEILVAIVVLSIGLVGLASLQLNGLKYNHSAYLRSQATVLAYDMIDRMRANMAAVTSGNYNNISGIPNDPGCISTDCTPSQMAQYDAREWNQSLAATLPSGQGTVTGDGTNFSITVMWDDDRTGATGTNCGSGDLKCFTMATEL